MKLQTREPLNDCPTENRASEKPCEIKSQDSSSTHDTRDTTSIPQINSADKITGTPSI